MHRREQYSKCHQSTKFRGGHLYAVWITRTYIVIDRSMIDTNHSSDIHYIISMAFHRSLRNWSGHYHTDSFTTVLVTTLLIMDRNVFFYFIFSKYPTRTFRFYELRRVHQWLLSIRSIRPTEEQEFYGMRASWSWERPGRNWGCSQPSGHRIDFDLLLASGWNAPGFYTLVRSSMCTCTPIERPAGILYFRSWIQTSIPTVFSPSETLLNSC